MPTRIRRAHADIRGTDGEPLQQAMVNDDDEVRHVVAAQMTLQVDGENPGGATAMLSTSSGIQSEQSISTGAHGAVPTEERSIDTRSPVIMTLNASNSDESAEEFVKFGPDYHIPWHSGSEFHLDGNLVEDGADEGNYTATAVVYYVEERSSGLGR